MLKFVDVNQETPVKRKTDSRKKDFNEIYDQYITDKAKEQSSRCSQCGVPFCQIHCPLQNNIPDWLKLTAEGRLKEAYEISQSTNNMPEVCGRICPQDRLCEGNCVIEQSGHGTVTIGSIEKYITEKAWENGWVKPIDVKNSKNQSIGIIGSGPAGLEATRCLSKRGYDVTLAEKNPFIGGRVTKERLLPGLSAWGRVVDYREGQINKLKNVNIYLESEITKKDILEFDFEHIEIAISSGSESDTPSTICCV